MPRTRDALLKLIIILTVWLTLTACHKNVPVAPPANQAPEASEAAPAPPGPPVCKLTAEPAAITQGQSVNLSWTSKDATDVNLDPSLGRQLTEGSLSSSPQSSTTYILTATGPGGSATCTARVTVSASTNQPSALVTEENIGGNPPWAGQIKDIFFDLDSSDLRPDAEQSLRADAELIKAHPGAAVTIEGNCDQRGSEEYNLGLGQRRATAARDFLVNLGVPAASLSTVSYGKDRLSCTDNSEECWQQNRRDHLRLQ
ncbi:MAG TPA: OmpA family protein [Terriglobia bacterium]|nr:OmpA family protein [Terriglobia bacterium]